MAESSDLEPIEWLGRLGPQLLDRLPQVEKWRRYYDGDHDLPQGPSQHREAFREFQKSARTNLCALCAESMVHRTEVTGFRDTSSDSVGDDGEVWKLWQSARLDARQFGIWRKAYSRSAAYVTVGVDPRNSKKPRVTIEGPENVFVETDPADPSRRLAALRLWHDPIVKRWMATVYLPGWRYHWQTVREFSKVDGSSSRPLAFGPLQWEQRDEPARSLNAIPVVPFLCGDEGEFPRAAFAAGIDVQNRLNLSVLNRLTAERYAAFRQRGILNFEPEVDPVTGATLAPFKPGIDQLWTLPSPEVGEPEPKMFDFQATETSSMLRGVEADMRAFAAVTLTPVYYLPGDLVNIGADSVAALDAGHVAKIRQQHTVWGEGVEETLQLMADVAGLDRDLSTSETVWMRPENFNPAVVADYMSKLVAAKIPLTMVCEEVGWSPQRVTQLRTEMAASAMLEGLRAPGPVVTPPVRAAEPAVAPPTV